jgi:hypothetical protein
MPPMPRQQNAAQTKALLQKASALTKGKEKGV